MRRKRTIVGRLAGGLLLAAQPLSAQLMPPPVVNPTTYESRSGEYVLEATRATWMARAPPRVG